MSFYSALQLVFSTLVAVWLIRGGSTSPEMALDACESPEVVYGSVAPSSLPHGNVTMYCVVMFDNATSADGAIGSWSRWPENKTWRLELGNGSFTTQHLPDNKYNMSLFLTNVTKSAQALYTFTVNFMNGKCLFSCPDMELKVEYECYNEEPQPIATDNNMTIIHTHLNALSLELVANYTGDTDTTHCGIDWWKGDFGDIAIRTSDKYLLKRNKHTLCSFTDKLIIHNLSMSDAGLYTAVAWGPNGLGNRTYFQVNIDQLQNPHKKSLNGFIALAIVVPIGIAVVVPVCVVCIRLLYIQRKRSHPEVRSEDAEVLLDINNCRENCGAEDQQSDSEDEIERDHGAAIWQTVPGGLLERDELTRIAGAITHSSDLVPYLGLSTAAIVEIERDYKGDYKEQKYQMLVRWLNQQPTPNTRQSLVRIIAEEMKNPTLAQEVTCIIQKCST